ncbi:sigma-70 family RNA polymerase sigma factor [Flavihumibacter sp. R14]|nr:sigma-70 family RNA polymerase sigma factor [Flavihumibacter soli]
MNLNESILWLALKDGDTNALFTIYEMLHPDLVRNGRTISGDEEQVKDTINQFFLYLWDKRKSLGDPDNLKSYLIVSFRRRLIYDIKLNHRTISLTEHEYELQPEPTAEELMINDTSVLENQLRIRHAIDKLPDRQKELLMLKYYENLSCEEIAKKTSLRIRTVYNKIHEAIKSLRKDLS